MPEDQRERICREMTLEVTAITLFAVLTVVLFLWLTG